MKERQIISSISSTIELACSDQSTIAGYEFIEFVQSFVDVKDTIVLLLHRSKKKNHFIESNADNLFYMCCKCTFVSIMSIIVLCVYVWVGGQYNYI